MPLNATVPQLEAEFKRFGPIKQNGIQIKSNQVSLTAIVFLLYCFTWSAHVDNDSIPPLSSSKDSVLALLSFKNSVPCKVQLRYMLSDSASLYGWLLLHSHPDYELRSHGLTQLCAGGSMNA